LFKVVPRSYSIRFEARATALVRMAFDDDAESWFGEVAMDFGES
jgi:hypothetical protein